MKYERRVFFFFMGGGFGGAGKYLRLSAQTAVQSRAPLCEQGPPVCRRDKGKRVLLIGSEFCECLPIKTGIVIGDNVRQFNV